MQTWKRIGFGIKSVLSHTYKNQTQCLRCSSLINVDHLSKSYAPVAKTSLKLPKEHTADHVGMMYTLDEQIVHRLFHIDGLTRRFKELNGIFRETCLMIREPAVTVIDYVNRSNLAFPPNKFILYGRNGAGKSLSLAHILHHLVEERWMVVHVAVPARWSTLYKEILPSLTREGFYDHIGDAAVWLQQFRQQNGSLLEQPDLLVSKDYQWTQREVTKEGSSILSLIDFGIARSRYASECVYVLLEELKKHAQEGRIRLGVVIDGINSFFVDDIQFKGEDKSFVSVDNLTLYQAFLKLLQTDWKNGVIVGSVDVIMNPKNKRKSYLPRYLLKKKGWETLDPFVPIQVNSYSDKEFENAVNYYLDRQWIQHPAGATKEGKEELAFLSGRNPLELGYLVESL